MQGSRAIFLWKQQIYGLKKQHSWNRFFPFLSSYKKQIEDAEEIAALNLAKYRKVEWPDLEIFASISGRICMESDD